MTAATSTSLGNCGDYRLIKKLGAGGMGEVFLAEHQLTGQRCAVKCLRANRAGDPTAKDQLRAESQALRQVVHPNCVSLLDDGESEDGRAYLVMELVPGRTLDELVSSFGPLPQADIVRWMRQLCSVLAEVHRHGLVHRDVKPANVMVIDGGEAAASIKLLDFGLAVSSAADEINDEAESSFSGSPHYAAPEAAQGAGAMDARSDIYSLGATAYHLLTGQPVFPGTDPLIVIFAHAERAPTPVSAINAEISAALEAIVMKCLAKQPDDRFQSMEELNEALSSVPVAKSHDEEHAAAWRLSPSSPTNAETSAAAVTCVNLGDTK